jgi:hypothetical protein
MNLEFGCDLYQQKASGGVERRLKEVLKIHDEEKEKKKKIPENQWGWWRFEGVLVVLDVLKRKASVKEL